MEGGLTVMVLGPISHWAQFLTSAFSLSYLWSPPPVSRLIRMMFVLGMCSVVDNPCDNL